MVKFLGKECGSMGYGLMGFTWRPTPTPPETAIPVMKAALEAGCNFWNAGEFYGTPEYNSCHLLNAYFSKYPEDVDKVILCIKGGTDPVKLAPTGDEEGIRRSIDQCNKVLDGKKKIDLFECSRVDKNVPIEESIEVLAQCVKEGKIGGITLSEVSAESIRRAAKVHKIEGVEVEFSMFSTDILSNGVAQACAEIGAPIIAYSPLGRGMLTGQIKKPEDIPEGEFRRSQPRFQDDAMKENLKLVKEVETIASKKSCAPGQIALAWVTAHSAKGKMPEIIPIPGTTTEQRLKENTTYVKLEDADVKELDAIIERNVVVGDRYGGYAAAWMWG